MTLLQVFLLTLGGALAYEGFAWAVGPSAMRRAYHEAIANMDDRRLGVIGLVTFLLGLALILLAVRVFS